MAVNVKVDGTTYEGINTITTGGKTLELKGGGGVEPIDPKEYYTEHRPATWPKIPLPSEMKDETSEYYEAGDCIYFFYKKLDTDIFLTDAIRFQGTNISATLYKYNDTTLVSSAPVTPTISGGNTDMEFELTSADADWNDYNGVVLKVTADAITYFNYAIQRKIGGLPLTNLNYYSSQLTELSMKIPNITGSSLQLGGSGYENLLNNLVFASFAFGAPTSTQYMFNGARSLEAIIEAFNTSAVTNMSNMFQNCQSLQTIPALDTSAVVNMQSMFQNCYALQIIPALDTSAVTNMQSMFNSCYALQTIPALNTSAVTTMTSMFSGCYALQTIPALDTSAVTTMTSMFYNCQSLQIIPALDTSAVTNMQSMFNSCYALQTIPALNTSAVTNMSFMFQNCQSLQTIPALNTSSVTDMSNMFQNCQSLQTIPALNTSAVTSMANMFYYCYALQTIPALDTSAVTNMQSMFNSCSSLQTIPALDTSAVTRTSNMFYYCFSLKAIDLSKWNFSSTNESNNMFSQCYALNKVIIREFGAGTVIYANPFANAYRIAGTTNAIYNPTGAHDGYIYVPDADVETIKAATNWSTYASQIKGLSELPAAA